MKKSADKQLVQNVVARVQKPSRTKRTLVLTEGVYQKFEKLCRAEGHYPSEVVDKFIEIYVEQKSKK